MNSNNPCILYSGMRRSKACIVTVEYEKIMSTTLGLCPLLWHGMRYSIYPRHLIIINFLRDTIIDIILVCASTVSVLDRINWTKFIFIFIN
jgi:hypothetical protein